MICVKALWRSSTLNTKLHIKAYTWKPCLPSSSVFCVHKHSFWKGLWIRKGFFFLLSVLKINFYIHIKLQSYLLTLVKYLHPYWFIFWFDSLQKQNIDSESSTEHWRSPNSHLHCITLPALSLRFSTIPKPCGSWHFQNSGVFLLKTIVKEAKKEISIYTFLALLTDFINHSWAYAAK